MGKLIVIANVPSSTTLPGRRIIVNRFSEEQEYQAIQAWKMVKDDRIYRAYQLTHLHGRLTMLRYASNDPVPSLSEFWRLFEIESDEKS